MRLLLGFLFFLSFEWMAAQNGQQQISVSFEDATSKEVIAKLEKLTGVHFFYLQSWLGEKKFSGEYKQAELREILKDLFANTTINFFVLDSAQVVLTRGNKIYSELPEGFFKEEKIAGKSVEDQDEYQPVLYEDKEDLQGQQVETLYFGKEGQVGKNSKVSLRGFVRDKKTGEPVANISVIVKGKNIGAITDQNGFYELKLPAGENWIETASLGNRQLQKHLIIFSDASLNFDLEEGFQELGEVLIKADADENVKTAVAGEEVIDVEKIKTIPLVLGERDILKVAATLPGISTAGEAASGYNVRGGKTDQNLILLDDAVIYNPAHFFGIFSAINPFTSGDVEIYKGSIPAEYGGRLSSVFDIKTKDAGTENFSGEASVGPVTSNLSLNLPLINEKAGLLVGGRSTYSDWILKQLDEPSLKNSEASFYDVVAKFNDKLSDRTEVKATGYFSRDNFSITSDSLYNYNNRLFSLRLNHRLNDRNEGSLILSNSQYNFGVDYESEFNENFSFGYRINETEAKLQMKYRHSLKHQFDYGVSTKLYLIKPGDMKPLGEESLIEPVSIPQERGLESAIFLSDDFKVNKKLLVKAGIRYSSYLALGEKKQQVYAAGLPRQESTVTDTLSFGRNEVVKAYGGPEFRVSARYLLSSNLSAKLSYNSSYQYIHTLSNSTTAAPTDTYKLSDLNIKPQRADQYSLGFYRNFLENMYEFSVEGYYKKAKDILDYKVGAQLYLNKNVETEVLQGEGKAYGVEVLLKKTEGRLNGWLSYTYSRSFVKLDSPFREERVNGGEYFPANYDKPHDLSLVANYKFTQRFSFSANFVYQTGRPVTFPVGKYTRNGSEYVLYSDRNQFRIPDYYRLDLSFNMEGNHKIKKFAHSFWNFSVYNVLGRNNPYSVYFVSKEGEIKAYKSSIFSVPVPTITYNFKF